MPNPLFLPDKAPGQERTRPDQDPSFEVVNPDPAPRGVLNLPDKAPRLRDTYLDTYSLDPDRAARVMDLSRKLHEPEAFIDKNMDAAERAASAPAETFWADLERQYPGTARFLTDRRRMAVAKDDSETLGMFEGLVRDAREGWRRGRLQVDLAAMSRAQRAQGTSSLAFESDIQGIERELGSIPDEGGIVRRFSEQLPNMAFSAQNALKRGLQGASAGAAGAAVLGQLGPQVALPEEVVTVPAAAALGFKIGGGLGFFEAAKTLEGELAFREFVNQKDEQGNPMPREIAAKYADMVGLVNGSIEATSDILLTKFVGKPLFKAGGWAATRIASRVPGADRLFGLIESNPQIFQGLTLGAAIRRAAMTLAKAEVTEISTEVAQETVTGAAGEAAKGSSGQVFEKQSAGDLMRRSAAVIVPTFQATLIPGVLGGGGSLFVDVAQVRKANQAKQVYMAMGASAEASKLRSRLPEAHREFVEQVTRDGPLESVYVPVEAFETYFQGKNLDPDQVAQDLGVGDALAEARGTGADIEVPLGVWTEKVVGTEHYQVLADDIKFSPEDLTVRQVRERDELFGKITEQEAEKALAEDKDLQAGKDVVLNDVRTQLMEAGRPEPEAKAAAQIWANRSVVEARKRGTTPEEWFYGSGPLRIVGGEPTRPRIKRADIEAQATAMHGEAMGQFEALRPTFDQWKELIGPGLRAPQVIAGQRDVLGEYNRLPLWMKNREGRPLDEVEQEAREAGLLREGEDVFVKLEQLRAPRRPGRVTEFYVEARRSLEEGYFRQAGLEGRAGGVPPQLLAQGPTTSQPTLPSQGTLPGPAAGSGELQSAVFPGPVSLPSPSSITAHPDFVNLTQDATAVVNKYAAARGVEPTFDFARQLFGELHDALGEIRLGPKDQRAEIAKRVAAKYPDIQNEFIMLRDKFWTDTAEGYFEARIIGNYGGFRQKEPKFLRKLHNHPVRTRGMAVSFDASVRKYFSDLRDAQDHIQSNVPEKRAEDQKKIGALVDEAERLYYQGDIVEAVNKSEAALFFIHERSDLQHAPNYLIEEFAELQKEMAGQTFQQPGFGGEVPPSRLTQDPADPRGFIQFTPRETLINLVKADASTFMHESAHFWLKDIHDFVRSGKAGQKYLADWKTLSAWLGVKDDQAELTVEQQEQFARGFEAYLREGKSPSIELKKVFRLFRRWLTKLYKEITSLNVELSDDVRGVLDRMVASEDEIALARQQLGYDTVDVGAMPKGLRDQAGRLQDEAQESAIEALIGVQMKELSQDHRDFLARELKRAQHAATEQAENLMKFRAIEALEKAFRLKKEDPKPDARQVAMAFLDGKLPPNEAEAFETLAEVQGYGSGDQMAKDISQGGDIQEEINSRVELWMSQYRDARLLATAFREEALRAVHNEAQEELMSLERVAFLEKAAEVQGQGVLQPYQRAQARMEAQVARKRAAELISSKPVQYAGQYMRFFTSERNAAIEATRALSDKNYERAAEFKRKQMFNHALAVESLKARAEIEKLMRYFERFRTRGADLKGMPYGFIHQIDTLLAGYELGPDLNEDPSLARLARNMLKEGEEMDVIANATGMRLDGGRWRAETLAEMVARVRENYYDLEVPDNIIHGRPINFKKIKLSDFRDLKASVEAINNVGRNYDRFLTAFLKTDIKTAALDIRSAIESNVGVPYEQMRQIGHPKSETLEKLEAIFHQPGDVFFDLVNILTLSRYLDGEKDTGPMQEYVYRVLTESENKKIKRTRGMVEDVNKLLAAHFTDEEFRSIRKTRVHFSFLQKGKSYLTREEMISVALNYGNEGNRDRLLRGFGLDDSRILEIINGLTKKEMDFVQAVWDHLETFWPEVLAIQMKIAGVQPKKVQATEILTRHGRYRGGYYPLAYDFKKSAEAYRHAEQTNALYKQFGAVSAHTNTGHTKARVDRLGRPIRLSLDVYFQHLENVVHDLSFREGVIDINRLLRQKDVRESVANALGPRGIRVVDETLKAVASDQGEFLDTAEKAVRWVRYGGTLFRLGFRMFSFPLDMTGNISNGIWEIGPKRLTRAMTNFVMNPVETIDFVNSLSERMRARATLRDRDINNLSHRWHGKDPLYKRAAFITMSMADMAVSYPLWKEVYSHNLAAMGPDAARQIADETVTRTMGSGSILDQAAIQRGTEYKKLWTWWYSWAGMMFNRAWLQGKIAGLAYDRGNMGQAAAIIGKTLFFGWIAQALIENFWRELFRNAPPDGVDEDKRKKRILGRFLSQPFGYVAILRDIAGYGVQQAVGGRSEISLPLFGTLETLVKPFADMARAAFTEEELNKEKTLEALAQSASVVFGVPQQLNTWVFNFMDFLNDEGELTWRDILTRRTRS